MPRPRASGASPATLQPRDPDDLDSSRPDGGSVEEASAESFPASDPPSFTSSGGSEDQPAPAAPVVAVDGSTSPYPVYALDVNGERAAIRTGSVVIAAITSCTNTSNPTVMVGAGLLARNA